MKSFDEMAYHPTAEKIVGILRDRTQRDDSLFFRIMVAYYFSMAAGQMRCTINAPDNGTIPVNMYALNLAPSGYGKTLSANLLEGEVLHLFRNYFLQQTFPILADENLAKLSVIRASRKGTDPDAELVKVTKEFSGSGPMLFSFDSGTSPAVKQMRHHLLLANAGSMNLIMDEVAANLSPNKEVFDAFIELYDKGLIKTKLIKTSTDNQRSEEILGQTPANLLMFGVPSRLLDGAKTEDELMAMLESGYARRCFFGFVKATTKKKARTAEQMYVDRTNTANNVVLSDLANRLETLADIINANKKLRIEKPTSILLNEYQLCCEDRANELQEHQAIAKGEMENRSFKVLKLAGAYAFIDNSDEITEEHIYNAIKLSEDSGAAFTQLLSREPTWIKLARYLGSAKQDVTQADLAQDLPFYKGSASVKTDMLNLAIAHGYKNNIIIKKSFSDGIEWLRGESLKTTDLNQMTVAYSTDMTEGYSNESGSFDKLHRMTQTDGLHWTAHHLEGGYRNEDNAIPGFNLVVIDVDGGTKIAAAKLLLKNYKFLLYTTKRHTEEEHRFRIILPINYRLEMDAKDYKEFMSNLYSWLPFAVDTGTNQRARKWLSNNGHYEYNDGDLLDALPFIPKTTKNEARKQLLSTQSSMDNLERWIMNNIGDGNRNNLLLRFAMVLVDSGLEFDAIRTKVVALNDKIADKLDEAELMGTIMVTVMKALAKHP